ncbi:MAG TPA: hypothetical protein VIJ75_04660 [Hanamia sp.]
MVKDIFPGKSRFLFFLNQLQAIIEKAESADNITLSIYEQNARTPLFMLEGLTRIYKKIHKKKKFSKLDILFKDFEDRLGAIDYYDGFHKEFINDKRMPDLITSYVNDKKEESIKALQNDLEKDKWIGKHKKRIAKIIKKLNKIKWLNEKEDTREILLVYQHYIDKVTEKYGTGHIHFTDLENDVHEMRRELRWLSIYPQALQGLMQLTPQTESQEILKKYITPEIVKSRFNVMPNGSGLQDHITINRNYFYGLSWIIAELGKLKDSALKIDLIEESIIAVYKPSGHTQQLAYSFCDESQLTISEILDHSQKIAQTFFDENILEHLICK